MLPRDVPPQLGKPRCAMQASQIEHRGAWVEVHSACEGTRRINVSQCVNSDRVRFVVIAAAPATGP